MAQYKKSTLDINHSYRAQENSPSVLAELNRSSESSQSLGIIAALILKLSGNLKFHCNLIAFPLTSVFDSIPFHTGLITYAVVGVASQPQGDVIKLTDPLAFVM